MSSNMEADSDIIIALFDPFREKLKTYRGYNIEVLQRNFRSILVLKSRYGDGDVAIGCNFFGKVNLWREMKKAKDIYDYEKYTDLNSYLPNRLNNETKDEENRTNNNIEL